MSAVAIQLLILALLLLAVPAIVGSLCIHAGEWGGKLIFQWISGHFLLWAGFQVICVPMVLRQCSVTGLTQLYSGYMAVLTILAAALAVRRWKKGQGCWPWKGWRKKKLGEGALLWAVFGAVLLFQLAQAVGMVFEDGDDAYYVSVASIAESSDAMYQVHPYGGGGTQLDNRHALAPFSIWIAFLARLSGMRTVVVAQVMLPVVLIAMAYGIYYLFSLSLFPEQGGQRALFMIFTELLVLFGNYSVYTSETFLIGRLRQGKAMLGSIVVPFLLLLLLELLKKLHRGERIPALLYLLLGAAAVTGCLCSTLGTLLICMAIGLCGVLGAFCYKRAGILLPLMACCIPCGVYALLYIVLK